MADTPYVTHKTTTMMAVRKTVLLASLFACSTPVQAFVQPRSSTGPVQQKVDGNVDEARRELVFGSLMGFLLPGLPLVASDKASAADEADFVQKYADFTETSSGWRYRDVQVGKGASPSSGDRVVFDWSGYTIGYFGRPFQAKGGPKGGAFDVDLDYSRTVLGSHEIVLGVEEALQDMRPGGVRQVVVPYGPLSYLPGDSDHTKIGPKPTTFSGYRALNFVLDNPRLDRTLLFNVKLVRIDKPNGQGGFTRG